jgi:hypothetical protein
MPINEANLTLEKGEGGYVDTADALRCAYLHVSKNCPLGLFRRVFALAIFVFAVLDAAKADTPVRVRIVSTLPACGVAQTRSQCTAESRNFKVTTFIGGPHATDVVRHCESICGELRRNVFGIGEPRFWQPKCQVMLHGTRQAYRNAVGTAGAHTVGSSEITSAGGRVTRRRIDLLTMDTNSDLSALPHELVHVLFADAFPATVPPKWAEEGLALMMDTDEKRARHLRDLKSAFQSKSELPLMQLFERTDYPGDARRALFYAQSLSVAEYLMQLDSPRQFMRFALLSADQGYERALGTVYGINTQELDFRWRKSAAQPFTARITPASKRGSS